MLEKLTKILHQRREKSLKSEKGQALVELAFVLPILLLLVFGIIEFGNIFFAHLTMNNATRDGARTGAIMATQHGVDLEKEIQDVIESRVSSLNYDNMSVHISPDSEEDISRGDDLVVELEYYRRLLTPLSGIILDSEEQPGYTKLTSRTTMRVE